ncbi:MAG TPA: hypothetical protein IGS52_05335 [Oscillatoriaceae cyanobacterium M33_DOE_052]|uniref:Uncharacterized protein n=1 Tax=Planktothricoides sp. SpSt-374 TaxID=2282167 RepID=A0A7C3ZU43_9CYAN|nr:hypothetical protein [Oscillatoriaceae cyanobacterium M33_DOE_052]
MEKLDNSTAPGHLMAKFSRYARSEKRQRGNVAILDAIRADGLNDLEIVTADLQHITEVITSVQRNYQALLRENRRLRNALQQLVDGCYCFSGNRCSRCTEILKVIANGD